MKKLPEYIFPDLDDFPVYPEVPISEFPTNLLSDFEDDQNDTWITIKYPPES